MNRNINIYFIIGLYCLVLFGTFGTFETRGPRETSLYTYALLYRGI